MSESAPEAVHLKDYTPPAYLVDTVDLRFELDEEATVVTSYMALQRNPDHPHAAPPLSLDGCELELLSLLLNDAELPPDRCELDSGHLVIHSVPESFNLKLVTRIRPAANTALEGLYVSRGMFCTQCEAEGFRRITYYPDRPDVMARFSVTLIADAGRYPVLLSNGNPVARGELDGGRHWARWEDPFRKPCYLFAAVAGDLAHIEDRFVTMSGREVTLRIYTEHESVDRCGHAMQSLKEAMQWDEQTFGREYDLDLYMIVAVSDFNMGAMENKGLNIFNSACVLARPDTATDADFQSIQGIIGHEYFHNWSGNRITCRDWFQLSLKEGLTVFRDQQFSAQMTSPAVKRIRDVRHLRAAQFPEDAGPMAHPVRPDSYVEISNFYTATVYQKGAEVIRMLHTLLGAEVFRKALDLYFDRHDGQAVTTDDFVACMEDASGRDLAQFRLWYEQAGTPRVTARGHYDAKRRSYTLKLAQHCGASPGQEHKRPLHIPVAVGLVAADGTDVPLQLDGEDGPGPTTRVLELTATGQEFEFRNVDGPPVPSVLRGFSAPVSVEAGLDDERLGFLFGHDRDPFNRWEAGQQLACHIMLRLVQDCRAGNPLIMDERLRAAVAMTLADEALDPAFVAEAITLPGESYLANLMEVVEVDAVHTVRQAVRHDLATALHDRLAGIYDAGHVQETYRATPEAIGRRRLNNACLGYLMELDDAQWRVRCLRQFNEADNMTDTLSALEFLANCECPERATALEAFYQKWQHDDLVLNKWLSIQATSHLPDTLQVVQRLLDHPVFDLRNPNRVRALIGAFCHANPVRFHDVNGDGYVFLADRVLQLDEMNPQIAARLVSAFSRWRRFDEGRQLLMRRQLERISGTAGLSRDVHEIVSKTLA